MEATAVVIRLPSTPSSSFQHWLEIKPQLKGFIIASPGQKKTNSSPVGAPAANLPSNPNLVSIPLPFLHIGGCTKHFISEWFKFTKDPFEIECICGCHLDMTANFGSVHSKLELSMSETEMLAGDAEVAKLLYKNTIVKINISEPLCIS